MTFLSGAVAALAALTTGGMAMGPSDELVRMSSLNAGNISGYTVYDRSGEKVGEVASVENHKGRTRWLNITLDTGGLAKVAAFRAYLDARHREVGIALPKDLLAARAGGPVPERLHLTTRPLA